MGGGRGEAEGCGSVKKKGPRVWPSVKMGWKHHFLCFSSLSPPLVPLSE